MRPYPTTKFKRPSRAARKLYRARHAAFKNRVDSEHSGAVERIVGFQRAA